VRKVCKPGHLSQNRSLLVWNRVRFFNAIARGAGYYFRADRASMKGCSKLWVNRDCGPGTKESEMTASQGITICQLGLKTGPKRHTGSTLKRGGPGGPGSGMRSGTMHEQRSDAAGPVVGHGP
jgi:hypothetical protein